jgi:hypothetical protein
LSSLDEDLGKPPFAEEILSDGKKTGGVAVL